MAAQDLLRNKVSETPTIYAYEHIDYPTHKGWLKVGYTTRDVETRVKEQNQTGNIQYRVVLKRPAMRKDGSSFTDKLVHRILRKDHIRNPEGEWFVCDVKKVEQFIKFLPILAFDGSSMKEIDAAGVLDMAMSGTTATLLARRWESAVLVNVDNATLQRLMNNPEAMKALMNIEGFRNLNSDIETIINKSEHVKNTKKEKGDNLTQKEKRQLTEEEKEYRSKRREIQEKLIKFATRIPVFMYLTDYREYCLKDVIEQLEPELFRKVTGLTLKDFSLLVSLGVFNSELMNDAVYKFKRYEDSSLEYTGIDKHTGTVIGLWDTAIDTAKMETPGQAGRDEGSAGREVPSVIAGSDRQSHEPEPWEYIQVGDTVVHKSIGPGKVMALDDKYIVVKFPDRESKFLYPGAFEKGWLLVPR